MTSIGTGTGEFSSCSNLTSILVENGNKVFHAAGNCLIETASKTLLAGCKNSVIPADGSVTSIDELAFRNCSELTSITIPDSVTKIGTMAFWGCTNLETIEFQGTEELWRTVRKGWSWDQDAGSKTSAGRYTLILGE